MFSLTNSLFVLELLRVQCAPGGNDEMAQAVARANSNAMRREAPSSSMQVSAGGKAIRDAKVEIGRHYPAWGREHGHALGQYSSTEKTASRAQHHMAHLEDHFLAEQESIHPEPAKEFGYYEDQPYGAILPNQVATIQGDPKTGLHHSCTATKAVKKAAAQCCSLSLDQHMNIEPEGKRKIGSEMTYRQADLHCENRGLRLCTVNEFEGGHVKVEDATVLMWTSDNCDFSTPEGRKFIEEQKKDNMDAGEATMGRLTFVVNALEKKEALLQEQLHTIMIAHAGAMESAKLPFTVDNTNHVVELKDFNLVIRSSQHTPGTGNLEVGLGHNVKHSDNGFVAGENNYISGTAIAVAGGTDNQAVGKFTAVLGGKGNKAGKPYATIAGGEENTAIGRGSQVDGGQGNTASAMGSVVAGGSMNHGVGKFAVVAAGLNNTASGTASVALNGRFNEAEGSGSGVSEGKHRINAMSSLAVS